MKNKNENTSEEYKKIWRLSFSFVHIFNLFKHNSYSFFAQDWFSSLFSGGTTTTVKPEPVAVASTAATPAVAPDANKWFEMIASHMATMNPSSTASTMNRTQVLKRTKYDDYQIWRITPSTLAHLEFLKEYKQSDEHENVLWLKGPAMRLLVFILKYFWICTRFLIRNSSKCFYHHFQRSKRYSRSTRAEQRNSRYVGVRINSIRSCCLGFRKGH